jgi:hypothetical protein
LLWSWCWSVFWHHVQLLVSRCQCFEETYHQYQHWRWRQYVSLKCYLLTGLNCTKTQTNHHFHDHHDVPKSFIMKFGGVGGSCRNSVMKCVWCMKLLVSHMNCYAVKYECLHLRCAQMLDLHIPQ